MSSPPSRPRSLEELLTTNAGLSRLTLHARKLIKLQRLLEETSPLACQARVVNIRRGKVSILTPGPGLANKLKQLEPRIVGVFQHYFSEVNGIEVKPQPRRAIAVVPRDKTPSILGPQQKQALTSLAHELPEDSALRASLLNLVARSR